MTKPKQTMKPTAAPVTGVDLDAFIAGAEAPQVSEAKYLKPAKQAKAPWEGIEGQGKLLLRMPARTKAMLDFINRETGIPITRFILDTISDAVEREAKRLYKAK